ncbi:hypothetical protein C0991_009058 [Blastosporella zonata]|nr:hypothetical protein C0991_009058 [Blastosporella zonata]
MTKLAILDDREEDRYETNTVVKCWACDAECGREVPEATGNPKIKSLIDNVMHSLSSARQSEVKAWEEEILPCEHTFTLFQDSPGPIPPSGLAQCTLCDLRENLWLCLTCGSLGCGRQQFGGVGGNGHGLKHFEVTGHPVSVKLGTITPEGGADVYCYVCNDAKLDPEMAAHLATFGINVQMLSKTEKSMTELQIEHNLKYDFSLTSEDGKALEPLFGPGLTGLANLGNSCYMASTLQALFSLPSFQARYNSIPSSSITATVDHAQTCPEPLPASCIECQLRKIGDGLLSGRYAVPALHHRFVPGAGVNLGRQEGNDEGSHSEREFQAGIRPSGLKALVGKGHAEFGTMRQQDAEEFFGYLVDVVRRDAQKHKDRAVGASVSIMTDATAAFTYALEQRLQCTSCHGVRYRTDTSDVVSVPVPAHESGKDVDGKTLYASVELIRCLETLLGDEELEGYACPHCKTGVRAVKRARFASFPEVLVVHSKKFQLVNWVPVKLDIPVILPADDVLTLTEAHLGRGIQPDEVALPEDASLAPALPTFDPSAIAALEGMGFPSIRAQKALLATGNRDAEAAMEWLFAHMEDPDIDDPIVLPGVGNHGQQEPPEEQIELIQDMGFTKAQGRKALRETGGDMERAVEWLFSHPEDAGEEEGPAASTETKVTQVPGTMEAPVHYRLKAFISHKGPSVHSGHYVAHVRVGNGGDMGQWVLFNDEKVVKADEESVGQLRALAYLWFFEKV